MGGVGLVGEGFDEKKILRILDGRKRIFVLFWGTYDSNYSLEFYLINHFKMKK